MLGLALPALALSAPAAAYSRLEPSGGDLPADTTTTGEIAVGGDLGRATRQTRRDVDWFRVSLTGGQTYTIDLLGSTATGCTLIDPVLQGVHDPDGRLIAGTWRGDGGTDLNSRLTFTPARSGVHYVAAAGAYESDYIGTGTYAVAVTAGRAPDDAALLRTGCGASVPAAPTGLVALAGTEGVRLVWTASGDSSVTGYEVLRGPTVYDMTRITTVSGRTTSQYDDPGARWETTHVYGIRAVNANGVSARSATATVTTLEAPPEPEWARQLGPGSTLRVAIGGTATGTLAPLKCKGGDGGVPPIGTIHWWKVDMETGTTYRIEVRGASTGDGTAENYRIRAVLDPGVTETGHGYGASAYADYAKNRIARVDFTAMRTGTHHVVVESLGGFNKKIDSDQCDEPDVHDLFGGRPGDKGTYTIAVDELTGLPSAAARATALTLGTRHEGELRRGHGVRDWYRVNLAGAALYEVTMTQVERNGKWLRWPTIYGVYTASDEALPRTRSIGGSSHPGLLPVESAPAQVRFEAPGTGEYRISVGDASGVSVAIGRGGFAKSYPYAIEIKEFTFPVGTETRGLDCSASSTVTSTSCSMTVGGTGKGRIESGDSDYWHVDLAAGWRYRIEIKGAGDTSGGNDNAGTLPDPEGTVRSPNIEAQVSDSDIADNNKNLRATYTVPDSQGGRHLIVVRGSGGTGTYTVFVTANTAPTASDSKVETVENTDYRFAADDFNYEDADGDALASVKVISLPDRGTLKYDGTALTASDLPQTVPATELGKGKLVYDPPSTGTGEDYASFRFKVNDGGDSIAAYTMTIDVPTLTETTDCGSIATTTCRIAVGDSVTGNINPGYDLDLWTVTLMAGRTYRIDAKGADTEDGTQPDPFLTLFDSAALIVVLDENDNSGTGLNARLSVPIDDGGKHFVSVSSSTSETGTYTLSVTDVTLDQTETTDCASDRTTRCSIEVGENVRGEIGGSDVNDVWSVEFEEGKTYQIDAKGADTNDGTQPDPYLTLFDSAGSYITFDNDGGTGLNARLTYVVPTGGGGRHFIHVSSGELARGTYTLTVTEVITSQPQQEAPPAAPLTAEFRNVPAEHDGSSAFTFELHFSEAPKGLSYRTLRGDAFFDVTNGTVTKAKRLVKKDNSGWLVTVEPASDADVIIGFLPALPADDCTEAAVVCTADGTRLSVGAATFVPGPASLSVADAAVQEGPGAELEFVVTLSRARHEATTVDYATSDGTATAGADYTSDSGTLTFEAGETGKTVSVDVLDDGHDEGSETMTFTLSNPAPSATAKLGDATATGTIENSDPMPQAWLARFGRTVAGHVLDGVAERMKTPRSAGVSATLGGQALPDMSFSGDGEAKPPADAETRAAEVRARTVADWLNGESRDDGEAAPGIGLRTVTGRELALGSSFSVTGETAGGATAAFWGRGAVSDFDGREGELILDGEVTTGLLGADFASGRWLLGLIASHSRGEGSYRGAGAGTVSSTLTGVHPWARYALSERFSVWGAAGYGAGTLTLDPDGEEAGERAMQAGLTLALAALGARGELLEPPGDGGGPGLALVSDAMFVRTASESTRGLAAASADVTRLRLALDGSWRFALAEDVVLTPSLELGVRHDGGDAESGFGVDIGGGLAFAHLRWGLSMELNARTLLAHEDAGFRERGLTAALTFDPRPSTDRGLTLSLRQSLGAASTGGAEALLGRETLSGLGASDSSDARRLELTAGYGVAMFGGRFTGTPKIGVGLSDTGRDYRLGWRLGLGSSGGTSFELGLEATRRESANDNADPEHTVGLRIGSRW